MLMRVIILENIHLNIKLGGKPLKNSEKYLIPFIPMPYISIAKIYMCVKYFSFSKSIPF